jgi:hypothetical protein
MKFRSETRFYCRYLRHKSFVVCHAWHELRPIYYIGCFESPAVVVGVVLVDVVLVGPTAQQKHSSFKEKYDDQVVKHVI